MRSGNAFPALALLVATSASVVISVSACVHLQGPPGNATFSRTAVVFANSDTELHGDVLIPAAPRNAPGVVIIHGSGTAPRTQAWAAEFAEGLAARGIAVLIPDKRGSGASGGDWKTASFDLLAEDAVGAVERLRGVPGVDADAVGVLGLSQGGHIAPRAGALSKNIAFVINAVGSTVPITEQIVDEVEKLAERKGFTVQQVAEVTRIHRLMIRYARTGQGWNRYIAARQAALRTAIAGHGVIEPFTEDRNHWVWGFARAIGDYDPLPHWHALTQPALIVYGAQDTQIRVATSVARLHDALSDGSRDYTVIVYGDSGHALRNGRTHALREDMLDFMASWIHLRTKRAARASPAGEDMFRSMPASDFE